MCIHARKGMYRDEVIDMQDQLKLLNIIEEIGEFQHDFAYFIKSVLKKDKEKITYWAYKAIRELAHVEMMLDYAKEFISKHTNLEVEKLIKAEKIAKKRKMRFSE